MTLTKLQKLELRKLDHELRRMEELSSISNLPLDSYESDRDYHYKDYSETNRDIVFNQTTSRKKVFEASKQRKQS
jgi:hypothetical protein